MDVKKLRWFVVGVALALFAPEGRTQTRLYISLDVPGLQHIDAVNAVHKMDRPGSWLFSVGVPAEFAGVRAESRDVVRFDGAVYSIFFRGGAVTDAIPANNGIDALYLEGSDSGDLILSFRAPVELPAGSGVIPESDDLLRYDRIGPGDTDWAYSEIAFDASAAGSGIPGQLNVIGADRDGSTILMALDNPARLDPSSGPAIYGRGQIVAWDGSSFGLLDTLVGWPGNRRIDGLSCQRAPGEVLSLTVERLAITGDQLRLN